MKSIKIKCPAKINLTLEIVNKRKDGFHNIKSIMQMVSLYDYLYIDVKPSNELKINLAGNSEEIPYNEKNLAYKAAQLYLESTHISNCEISIYIEKNIPVAAGLAGGSTDAAGTLYGLNKLYQKLNHTELEELCAKLGSDLNVCLNGGCTLATSRGEVTKSLPVLINYSVSLIKPINLGISAKEAYTKYALIENKIHNNMTEKIIEAIQDKADISQYLYNDLETAVFEDYPELQQIKQTIPDSIMSGSGSTYFVLNRDKIDLKGDYQVFENLQFIENGVSVI